MPEIEKNLTTVNKLISSYEQKYGREKGSVHLLAVSKSHPIESVLAAIKAGQLDFGESYLQEALAKMAEITDKSITWHFIGPIQSNKTKKIAEHFSWVHSVASTKIAKRLNDQRPTDLPPLNICLEINVSGEKTKSGVTLDEVTSLAEFCANLPRLKLRGLMTIPAPYDDINDQRREFHKLVIAAQSLRARGFTLDVLSMGMSEDFEAAIAEGATIVRIGTAIFGERETVKT